MAKWQIFLFDFDGTLVNSEKLHHQAYLRVAQKYGIDFAPDFTEYAQMAHFSDHALKDRICSLAPSINWQQFYGAKKRVYLEILDEEKPELMEGVQSLLERLARSDVLTCVVTHSAREQTESFIKRLPILQTIGHWITREDYEQPKPASDGYQVALHKLGRAKNQKVVGFEDSIRGLKALLGVEVDAFLVAPLLEPSIIEAFRASENKKFNYIRSFEELEVH